MKTLQKFGGFAALYLAAGYIVGMIGFLTVVDVSSVADPVQKVALMADNLTFLYILHLIVYVVWGIFMVVLALALYERLKAGSPAIVQRRFRQAVPGSRLPDRNGSLSRRSGLPSITDPAQRAALLVEKQMVIFSTNLLMYVFFRRCSDRPVAGVVRPVEVRRTGDDAGGNRDRDHLGRLADRQRHGRQCRDRPCRGALRHRPGPGCVELAGNRNRGKRAGQRQWRNPGRPVDAAGQPRLRCGPAGFPGA